MLDLSPLGYLAASSFLLVVYVLFKIHSASRSPLHRLPGPKRGSLLLGNVLEAAVFSSSERNHPEEWVNTYGGVVRVHGLLGTQPELCVADPEFLYRAFISDNDSWPRPEFYYYVTSVLLGPSLGSAHGETHRRQRKMLNPMFTAEHTRALMPSIYEIGHKLSQKISGIISSHGTSDTVVDVLEVASASALDVVGSAGLGYDFDALGVEHAYARAMKHLTPTIGEVQITIPFLKPLSYLGPYSFRSWLMDTFCPLLGPFGHSITRFRHILKTMADTAREIYRDRQVLIASEDALGGSTQFSKADVLSNLVRASKESNTVLNEEEAVAHINTLVFAGFETSSNAISRLLDILSTQQDLQDQLRTEILKARADMLSTGDLPYDTIMGLPLLDAVVREVLRFYPPVPVIVRESSFDMVVPVALPVKSSDSKTEIREVFVPKNTTLHVSITGLNRSQAVWGDDAKEFKPERWLRPEGPVDVASNPAFARIPNLFSPGMTFSAGPRGCIGWRMAILEIKIILVVLLQNFVFQQRRNQKIKWMSGTITYPTVIGDERSGPQLPLVVSEVTH